MNELSDPFLAMYPEADRSRESSLPDEIVVEAGDQPAAAAELQILGRTPNDVEKAALVTLHNFGTDIAGSAAHRAIKAYGDVIKAEVAGVAAERDALKAENASLRRELTQRELGLTGEDAAILKTIRDKLSRKPGNLLNELPALGREMMVLMGIGGLVANDYKPSKTELRQIVTKTAELFGGVKGGVVIPRKIAIGAVFGALIMGGVAASALRPSSSEVVAASPPLSATDAQWSDWLFRQTPVGDAVRGCAKASFESKSAKDCVLPKVSVKSQQ